MSNTMNVTSRLLFGVPVTDMLTIMPGVTNVDADAWKAWAATKPDLIDSGDITETPAPEPEKADSKDETTKEAAPPVVKPAAPVVSDPPVVLPAAKAAAPVMTPVAAPVAAVPAK